MVKFTNERLEELEKKFEGKRIAVVGDLMVDRYLWGVVGRISPEAPVPIVEVESSSSRLGGAANVANNIATLGGIPVLFGIVGNDDQSNELRRLAAEGGMETDGIITDPSRPTTVKTRVIAHSQHVVRIDSEVKADISAEIEDRFFAAFEKHIDSIDAVILEDYNKGVMTKRLLSFVLEMTARKKKISTVDPKFNNFFEYKRATVFKPNRKETEEALGKKLHDPEALGWAGKKLVEMLDAENVLMTLGERGMTLFEKNGEQTNVSTIARKVADVSGAGDTVISTLTVALAAGANIREAVTLANYAGGIVCGEVGVVPIERKRLFAVAKNMSRNGKEYL